MAATPSPRKGRQSGSALVRRIRKGLRWRSQRLLRKLGTNRNFTATLLADGVLPEETRLLHCQKNRRTSFSGPKLYDQGLEIIRQPPLQTSVPDLQLLELRNVEVVGGTMAILRDGQLLHPELLHTKPRHDEKATDVCHFADAARRTVNFTAYRRFGGRATIKVGLHLLKEHAVNYYHWLFEGMPRLLYFLRHRGALGIGEKLSILIDENMVPGGLEALRRVLDFPHEIEIVRRGELVACEKLFYVSPFWYSLDNSRHQADPYHDYAVDQEAVGMVREAFRSLMSPRPPTRCIFLPRAATQVRRISNTPEVDETMRQLGFEILYAHDYTFAEQVELFSSTRVLIGPSGAAFSNLVFMQPGTKAVIISPKQMEVFNYYIFQQLADVAQVDLAHLLAVPAKHDDFYVHDDFAVNCNDLRSLARRLVEDTQRLHAEEN